MPEKITRRVQFTPQARSGGSSVAVALPAEDAAAPAASRWRARRVRARELSELTRTLATLTDAGLPIVKALTILEGQQPRGPLKRVMQAVVEEVSAGTPLSVAMANHSKVFDPLYVNMVRAGEASGELNAILVQLAEFLERTQDVKDRIKGASVYPVVVLCVAVTLLTVIFLVVIPKFEVIFASFQMELPWQTSVLIDGSRFVVRYWYVVFGVPILLYLAHAAAVRRAARYRLRYHRLALRIPLVGALLSKILIGRFSRTFGTLVKSGVPHLEGLDIVRSSIGNDHVANAVERVRTSVREGEGLAQPMGESGVFDDVVVNLVAVGESTGELDRMMLRLGAKYEVDVNRRLEALFKVFEPALLLAMAAVVGFIVVALFLPLLKIMDSLGQ